MEKKALIEKVCRKLRDKERVLVFLTTQEARCHAQIYSARHEEHVEFWKACLDHNHERQIDILKQKWKLQKTLEILHGKVQNG